MSIQKFTFRLFFCIFMVLSLSACGVNNIPEYDEQVKAAWSQVENQYQRRADLIPNLVNTVKGYTNHERQTLEAVVNARSKVGAVAAKRGLSNDKELLRQFENAQSEMTSALSRLMVVVERYPDLKANQNFLRLHAELEGSENRIAVARRDYIEAIKLYNAEIRTFPGKIWHDLLYSEMEIRENYYKATKKDAEKAPEVQF